MFERVAKLITLETGFEHVQADTLIRDLGIDSLEFLSLLLAIEADLGKVPEEKIAALETVGDIADALILPN